MGGSAVENGYKLEIMKMLEERMLNDPYTSIVVKTLVQKYLDDMKKDECRGFLEKLVNEHFDELMLSLFTIHFKAYDDILRSYIDNHKKASNISVIVTDKDSFEKIKKTKTVKGCKNLIYEEIKRENDGIDKINLENQRLYKEIRREVYGNGRDGF